MSRFGHRRLIALSPPPPPTLSRVLCYDMRPAAGRGVRGRGGGGFHKHNIEKGKVTVYLDELKWKSSHAARGRGGGERDLVDSTPLSLTPHSRRERPWWHSTVHSTLTDPCAPAPPTHNGLCPSANYGTSASAA